MKRRFLAIVLLLAAGACVRDEKAELQPAKGEGAPAGPKLPPLPPAVEPAAPGTTTHRFVGTTYADEKVSVAAEGSGTLAEVSVDVGDKVKKGQVLFRLKANTARIGVKRSRAGLEAARTALATAKRELARMKELSDAGAISPAALDNAQAGYDAALIQVEQAELGVTDTTTSLADRTVRSPIDGVVTERFKHPGEAVTSMPPTIVLELQDQSVLELRLRVPEALMRSVEPGTSMRAHFTALDVEHDVKVDRLGAEVDPRTRTIEVVCLVTNKDLRLKPGMSADVVLGGSAEAAHAAVKREESSP